MDGAWNVDEISYNNGFALPWLYVDLDKPIVDHLGCLANTHGK